MKDSSHENIGLGIVIVITHKESTISFDRNSRGGFPSRIECVPNGMSNPPKQNNSEVAGTNRLQYFASNRK